MIKKRLIGLLSDAKKYIVHQIVWQWLSLLCQIIMIATAASLLEKAYERTIGIHTIGISIAVVACAILLRAVCDKMAGKASFLASRDVKRILRKTIYEKMLRLGTSYQDKISTAEVVQMSTEGVEQLEIYFGKYLAQLFYSLLAPITLFILLSFVNVKASAVLLICVPLIPASIVAVQKFAKKLLSKYWGAYTELGDSFLENLQGLTTLKIYQADQKKSVEMDQESDHFRKVTMKVLTMQLNSTSVMDIIAYGGAAVGMIVTVNEFISGHIGLAGTIMIVLLASEFFIPLRLLGSFFHIAMNGMAASDKIFALLDLPEPEQKSQTVKDEHITIRINDLTFGYEEERTILKKITTTFTPGGMHSLVGVSGSGKSTIAGLLMKRNTGYQGNILINEVNLNEINEEHLMNQITLVSHDSYLFKGSVMDNLRMGNPDATVSQMEDVLKKVNLYTYLNTQQGLSTQLSEKGNNLSGGQRQRLAIARALLHDTSAYIFDEATSNIDVDNEEQIMKVIKELSLTKTVVFISHRLANVVDSKMIYMLENGEITEQGTHEELMRNTRGYYDLYEKQHMLETYVSKSMEGKGINA